MSNAFLPKPESFVIASVSKRGRFEVAKKDLTTSKKGLWVWLLTTELV